MNALEDPEITRALYEASMAGVQVGLIIRDTCRLRPGVAGVSENVRVISIVGRFLEHARLFYFRNAGDEVYLFGSADYMTRNLESCLEVAVPVEDERLRAQLRKFIDIQLDDHRQAWEMQADGSYVQRQPRDENDVSSHDTLMELAANAGTPAHRP